jgi:hypothetical protein
VEDPQGLAFSMVMFCWFLKGVIDNHSTTTRNIYNAAIRTTTEAHEKETMATNNRKREK